MTDKEVKKLSRTDLLRLLIQQTEENERLAARNASLEQEFAKRTITMEKSGSIAEAALGLTNVFAEAQDAANRYLESIRAKESQAADLITQAQQELDRTRAECAKREEQTTQKCRKLEEQTRQYCTRLLQQTKQATGTLRIPQED